MSMLYKQDFTNVLELEIKKLQEIYDCIAGEIAVREKLNIDAENYVDDLSGYKPPFMENSIEYWQNRKSIAMLKSELVSKKDYIQKLQEKNMMDMTELDEDFKEIEQDKYLEYYQKIDDAIYNLNSKNKPDDHDQLRVKYIRAELDLWLEEDSTNPSRKEACVFYFRALKSICKELGIE